MAAAQCAAMLSKRLLFLLALFLCCAAPAAAGLMWQPYTGKGPPGTYVEPVKAKVQDRLPVHLVTPVPYRLDPPQPKPATLADLVQAPWPCERIRKAVDEHGREKVKAYARAQGYTKKQIDEAMACVAGDPCGPRRYDMNRKAYGAGRPQPC